MKIQLAHILVDMSTPRVDGNDANAEAAAEQGMTTPSENEGEGEGAARPALQPLTGADGNALQTTLFGGAGEDYDLQTPLTKPGQLRINVPKDPPVMQLQHQTTVNWKEGYVVEPDGSKRQLSAEELENLRRERNRMHAKMTRDRKKNLITTIENVSFRNLLLLVFYLAYSRAHNAFSN